MPGPATGTGSEHLTELEVSVLITGQWDQMACKGLFQLKGSLPTQTVLRFYTVTAFYSANDTVNV